MRVLVTGGAGFIGSHLVEHFLERGDEVLAIDNLSTGSLANLATVRTHSKLCFEEQDVVKWEGLQEALAWSHQVYHLAAMVGQKIVLANPSHTLMHNIALTERIAALAQMAKQPPAIFIASTSEVYAESCPLPFSEEEPIVFPSQGHLQECYRLSKFVNEKTLFSYASRTGAPCLIGRLFNTVGPRQRGRYGMVLPTFVRQALSNQSVTVYGSGAQTRSFAYVKDVVSAIVALMNRPSNRTALMNIGGDKEIAIAELAHLVIERAQSASSVVYIPYQQAYGVDYTDCMRRRPDLSKMRQYLPSMNWMSLPDIIDRILEDNRSSSL